MRIAKTIAGGLALGTALMLVAPKDSQGWNLLGHSLGQGQRDFRVFNNFSGAGANNNVIPEANFPGYVGAVLAIWKGCVEWSSVAHGDGSSNDSTQPNIGDGGANFDPSFQAEDDNNGGSTGNTHAMILSDNPGVFAFQVGGSNGWRIRYHQNHNWADGPVTIGQGQADLQGIACHEYGHALGLAHSDDNQATMRDGGTTGDESLRSITADDSAGLQAIYGAMSGSKPVITGLAYDDQTDQVTITGTNFLASGNEVWFTQAGIGGTGTPVKLTSVGSTGGLGTEIIVTLPGTAGNGDVLVRNGNGFSGLSNPWPISVDDIVFPGGPMISSISPPTVQPLYSGTGETVTINGVDFDTTNDVTIAGLDVESFTVVNNNTITIQVPILGALGPVDITVATDLGFDAFEVDVVAPATPVLRLNNGAPVANMLTGLPNSLKMGGTPGNPVFLWVSGSNVQTPIPGLFTLDIGNLGLSLFYLGVHTISPWGWGEGIYTFSGLPPGTQIYWQSTEYDLGTMSIPPVPTSNVCQGNWIF